MAAEPAYTPYTQCWIFYHELMEQYEKEGDENFKGSAMREALKRTKRLYNNVEYFEGSWLFSVSIRCQTIGISLWGMRQAGMDVDTAMAEVDDEINDAIINAFPLDQLDETEQLRADIKKVVQKVLRSFALGDDKELDWAYKAGLIDALNRKLEKLFRDLHPYDTRYTSMPSAFQDPPMSSLTGLMAGLRLSSSMCPKCGKPKRSS